MRDGERDGDSHSERKKATKLGGLSWRKKPLSSVTEARLLRSGRRLVDQPPQCQAHRVVEIGIGEVAVELAQQPVQRRRRTSQTERGRLRLLLPAAVETGHAVSRRFPRHAPA